MSDKQIETLIKRLPRSDPNYDEFINVIIPSLRESENNKWTCPYCSRNAHFNANYSSYFAFTRHLAQRHRDSLPLDGDFFGYMSLFRCEICDKEFSRKDHYNNHLKSKTHIKNQLSFSKNVNDEKNDISDEDESSLADLLKATQNKDRIHKQSVKTKQEHSDLVSTILLPCSSKRPINDIIKNRMILSPITPDQSNLGAEIQKTSRSSKRRLNYEYETNYEINSPVEEDFSLPNFDLDIPSLQSTPKKSCLNKQTTDSILSSSEVKYELDKDIYEAINEYYYNSDESFSNDSIPSAQQSKYDESKRSCEFEYENIESITREQTNKAKRKIELVENDDDDDDDNDGKLFANWVSSNAEKIKDIQPTSQKVDENDEDDLLLNTWISQNIANNTYIQAMSSKNDNNLDATQLISSKDEEVKSNQSKFKKFKRVRFNE